MRELNNKELTTVSGGTFDGMLWGIMDGIASGAGMAKFATGGSIMFGAFAQLVGVVIAPIIGGFVGGVIGLMTDRDTVAEYAQRYRETMGK
ncbi:DUF5862 family protein [Serratia rhizosphaerae]|uniref:DUF5862 family protein n=1 Tax=unclassified Serratia (in: enterobacteria) TaxID=2647522 RepID=UPI000CF6066E|nr:MULTISPECIES: bacteriocin [unclassified Serratia (in: enterobacteria)]MBU3893834.1 bacteriocin [Serratia rubidaea]AVJ19446.1 hypothetical protein CLM71_21040 [Serratia sp. MYb239]MCA4825005.1 bacteriocin [Serratia rubidaea]QNK32953.1 bacteriocin [Serratia sp. JUb9]QPT13234.1 bacteriocin [Serratia rubidaea]